MDIDTAYERFTARNRRYNLILSHEIILTSEQWPDIEEWLTETIGTGGLHPLHQPLGEGNDWPDWSIRTESGNKRFIFVKDRSILSLIKLAWG